MNFLRRLIQARLTKAAGAGLGALLAAIGGVTSIQVLQPAVEKASDYGARAAEIYCELPLVDRERFRSEVLERLVARAQETGSGTIDVRVSCPVDGGR
jgi:hypothetical protein